MSYLSNYCRNMFFGSLLGMETFPKPDVYVGFSTTIPVDLEESVTEPTAADYNRVLYTHWKISGRDVLNNTTITWYTKSNWGTLVYFLLWDAPVDGNLLGYGALPAPIAAGSGKVISFKKGDLQLRFVQATITDYLTNRFLEHLFGNVALVAVNTYVGLSYTNPGPSGTPTTPVSPDYHDIPFLGWQVTDDSRLINIDTISFTPTRDWGILPYLFIRDADNRILFYSAFITPVVANPYSPVHIEPTFLTIVFD